MELFLHNRRDWLMFTGLIEVLKCFFLFFCYWSYISPLFHFAKGNKIDPFEHNFWEIASDTNKTIVGLWENISSCIYTYLVFSAFLLLKLYSLLLCVFMSQHIHYLLTLTHGITLAFPRKLTCTHAPNINKCLSSY